MLSTARFGFVHLSKIAHKLGAQKCRGKLQFPSHLLATSVRFYSASSYPCSINSNEDKKNQTSTDIDSAHRRSIIPKFLQPYLPMHSKGWVVLGSGIVALGVSRVFYGVTYSFLGLTPATSLYYGFIGGLITAASSVAVIWWGDQTFRVAPERAVHYSLEHLNKTQGVIHLMGGNVQLNSVVRSYSVVNSQIAFSGLFPKWVSPYVEIAYTVKCKSSNIEAVVTCVYGKKGIKEVIDYLAIEPQDGFGNKLVVIKKDAYFTVSNALKKHANDVLKVKSS